MPSRRSAVMSPLVLGVCAFVLALAPDPAQATLNVALTPATQVVAPGADFDVFVDVTNTGTVFNGFDLVVGYDPAALTFLPLSPISLQQGCLMAGGCSLACGNTFHLFNAAADSLKINDVLLCNGVTLQGPGHLYKLRFRASNTEQATLLTIRDKHFFDAGLFVAGGVQSAGCLVNIGEPLAVGPSARPPARTVRVEPNPAFGHVNFFFDANTGGPAEIEILDLQGRVVRDLGPSAIGPQSRLSWDGHDARGFRAPAGLYLVKIRRGGQVQNSRVLLLQ